MPMRKTQPGAGWTKRPSPVVRPGMWTHSAGLTCRGKNQEPRSLDSKGKGETLKPIDKAIVRMVANHQAVAQANAYVASKVGMSGGRACNRRAKAA